MNFLEFNLKIAGRDAFYLNAMLFIFKLNFNGYVKGTRYIQGERLLLPFNVTSFIESDL